MASVEGSDTYEPVANKQLQQQPVRIILLVEATAAAASGWSSTRKWLDVILQKMDMEINALADVTQRHDPSQGANSKIPRVQYALLVYGVRDRSTPATVQCSAWTPLRSELATWLDGIQFVGGVASKGTALPQALAEAIVLSKCPYPGGMKPAAAAASHPEAMPESDISLPVHTHLVVCCPAFNPCRLPMVWPCPGDTKARLFEAKFYHRFLEKFATLQAEKADRVMYGLCNQLDFIKGSLHRITPGTVDVWDLIMALPRHHLSLSVISSSLKSAASRTCLELFAYGNYPVSKLKLAVQRCVMCASSVGVGVYLSPLFTEGQRAFKPIWGKLLEKRKQLHQQAQQQQQQRQQHQQAHSQGASTTAATSQQQGAQHTLKQAAQHAAHQASQQHHHQQQAMQQAQAAAQQQARQYKQQQAQVQQQQQQKAQQQHWQQATAHPAVATPPTAAATAASIASACQAQQQQRMAATQAAGMQQQQLLQQQQRYGMVPVGQAGAAVQPHQQQQQLPVAAQAGMGMGMNTTSMMSQQQPQQKKQQQSMVMLVQPGMQQMLVQQQAGAGFMQPQQLIPQQMLQQQQQQQQLLQQQQQMPMAAAPMAPALAAVIKQEKARVAFWSGQIVLSIPELSQQAVLAQVELSCSNPGAMKQTWAQRKHLVAHKVMHLQDVRQMLATYKLQITKVAYKVLQQVPSAWQWLQQQVIVSPQKQVFMLVQLTPSYQGVFFFGNQATKGQSATTYNLNEGSFILCGVDS